MEKTETIKKFQYILELQEIIAHSLGDKLSNSYQFSYFSKEEKGKWNIEYIPIANNVDVLQQLEQYKRNSSIFKTSLRLDEDGKEMYYRLMFRDYTFSMDYKSDHPLTIYLSFQEVG